MKKSVLLLILLIAVFVSGCVKEETQVPQVTPVTEDEQVKDGGSLDDYMASIEEQSEAIKHFLEHDAMTQADMNEKSQELYELWDKALNDLWGELKNSLPEDEFDKLLDEQLAWIAEKEDAAKAAGEEFEGGSVYPLIVNSEAARITEERVYEFYELLK